jgi:large conductance mechanosensitive channel
LLKEFKQFILRGNVVDLAVGIVIGAAFTGVVNEFVNSVINPILGLLTGGTDFSSATIHMGEAGRAGDILYGAVINAVISFVLVAGAVFFLVVKPINHLMDRRRTEPDVVSPTKTCPECFSNIPEAARRCPFCTSNL